MAVAVTGPPDNVMPAADGKAMLRINVQRLARLLGWDVALSRHVIGHSQLKVRGGRDRSAPVDQGEAAVNRACLIHKGVVRRAQRRRGSTFADIAGEEIRRERQGVGALVGPVEADTATDHIPVVTAVVRKGIAVEILDIRPDISTRHGPTVARLSLAAQVARDQIDGPGIRCRGLPGDDVDDTIDRIGSPHRGPRTSNHLDPVDRRDIRVIEIPVHPRVQRGIKRAAVHQHEQLVGKKAIGSACCYRP